MSILTPPRIAHPWPEQGGIYLGAFRVHGQPDHGLVLAAALPPECLNWKDARAWARAVTDSAFADWTLMRKGDEGWIAQASALIEPGLYWLDDEYDESAAWGQFFDFGFQSYGVKKFKARARAVRRFPLWTTA